jgi:hypothetical protein
VTQVVFLFNLVVVYVGGFSSNAASPPAQVAGVSFPHRVGVENGLNGVLATVTVGVGRSGEGKGNCF